MSNYVQDMWQNNSYAAKPRRNAIVAWVLGTCVAVAIAAVATERYWYPYISSYL